MSFRSIIRNIVLGFKSVQSAFCRNIVTIDCKKVFFEAYQGRRYACSPKALYEEMLANEEYSEYSFVWAVRDTDKYKFISDNKNTKIVKFESFQYYKEMASAKYWVFNSKTRDFVKIKPGQIYLQTWHGTPFKKIGCDVPVDNAVTTTQRMLLSYTIEAKKMSYIISPSAFCSEKFKSAFNLKNTHRENIIIETGYPRNDRLFKYTSEETDRIKYQLGIPGDKKVILYAPTFRDDKLSRRNGFALNIEIDFDRMKEEFGNDYIILFRAHYFIACRFDFNKYKDFVYDVSDIDDINDLYIISDMLVTDYSSVFFDYANLKRPIVFYMYDFKKYKEETRDLYFGADELPGTVTTNMGELINAIKDISTALKETGSIYNDKYKQFNEKFNYLDGPDTSKEVLKAILK
ncbi:MAG: CDP-glycerol glycerophosphotransferase family protein [Eubacterium sp.]